MFPTFPSLRAMLKGVLGNKEKQGHVVTGLADLVERLPESYDAFWAFARMISSLPLRPDWPYVEPNELDEIWAECDPARPTGQVGSIPPAEAAARVESAFLSSCCGCILGKPLEFNPALADIRRGAEAVGDWPLRDYVRVELLDAIGKRHGSWATTCRGHISFVAPDDDINYTILGMLAIEKGGVNLTRDHVRELWLHHLPIDTTFGPERTMLVKAGIHYVKMVESANFREWVTVLNPGEELCGAVIRADAYGYACTGRPALAAELAWRDAGWTHRRTGIYGTMFVAAAIATAQVCRDALEVFATALKFVPRRSRFHHIVADSLSEVRQASDWLDGYNRVHGKYGQYTHCHIYQEIGTLINTLRFAKGVGDGICMQVMQGNDTDSFGATAGSILGAFFGPGHLEERWLRPFNDEVQTALAWFPERRLSALGKRMGLLPGRIEADLSGQVKAEAPSGPGAAPGIAGI